MNPLYQQIRQKIEELLSDKVRWTTRERLALVVAGIIQGGSGSPAAIARALDELGVTAATPASIERRIRRTENDTQLTAVTCFHPLVHYRLRHGRPRELLLILDPTTQDERLVMVTVAIWYRGRSLPLAWPIWPGQVPLEGAGFWERIATLLAIVAELIPSTISVTWLADRAFGTRAFIDLLTRYQWYYIVRVQSQTRFRDDRGRECSVADLVRQRRRRAKRRGACFKKRGWRPCSVVVYQGRNYPTPLCLVSNWPPEWRLIDCYQRRYAIETLFRHYKSAGWQWEQGQVVDLDHVERLLVAMAWATWLVVMTGTAVAQAFLETPPSGRAHNRPFVAKSSLFSLGLHALKKAFCQGLTVKWFLTDWNARSWHQQARHHIARAFVFSLAGS